MTWFKNNLLFLLLFFGVIGFFFRPILSGRLPIPADNLVGLYHPYRDFFSREYPSGIPYKNFLLTDPVRQQFLWKRLAIDQLKRGQLPWWNPYTHSGTPLLANFQAGVFYPLNFVFFLFNFTTAWTMFIVLQPVLAGLFLYLYLKNLKLFSASALLAAFSFVFSGFFISWLEWGNIGHTILWLPLILLAIDKQKPWLFTLALISQFFAGHLQVSLYVILMSLAYIIYRRRLKLFAISYMLFAVITAIQWLPTLQFIKLSARATDQSDPVSFLPFKHLVQFIAPDFFGNPATLNYWGDWNYAEFVGYIGLIPLIFALSQLFAKSTKFFSWVTVLALIFALPTPIAKIPFIFNLPFLSQAQPSRLLALTAFSLSVLGAFGFEKLSRRTFLSWKLLAIIIACLWFIVPAEHRLVTTRNLILPTAILVFAFLPIWRQRFKFLLLFLAVFELLRFGQKFTPFSPPQYLYPRTKAIEFLNRDQTLFRIMAVDRRILPPNFTLAHGLQTIEGYDPLYLKSYANLITELETGQQQAGPLAFNRIISPSNLQSDLLNQLNVKYILSLTDLNDPELKLVFQEGETRIYQNLAAQPRARLLNPGTVDLVSYQPNTITLSVTTTEPNTLELADMMYPGWQAKINGQSVPVTPSEFNFRRIPIPSGESLVTFFYDPL